MLGLLFPGQGSQRVGMGADLCEKSAAAARVFERADAVTGLPIQRVCFEGPDEELRATENAQPALVATELAALAALGEELDRVGDFPTITRAIGARIAAGHSLGSYSAAVAVGALQLDDALRLAARRGAYMAAAPSGAMAAILGLDVAAVERLCQDAPGTVAVANDNAPGQVVISGAIEAVDTVAAAARGLGAKTIALKVSGAFHSPLMRDAARAFAVELDAASLSDPRLPLVGNVSAGLLTTGAMVRTDLASQIDHAVRWRESMNVMAAHGVTRCLEVGPGNVLAGLARRCTPAIVVQGLGSPDDVTRVAATLAEAS
jgi:[acyl-carrier-protein] S-malonyltransferase